jgi:type II secretory pathway pseudopilin PulG
MIEIMLVLAIMGVILTIGIPTVFHSMQKSPMRQAVSDLEEGCRAARIMAILQSRTAELVIRADDRTLSVQLAPEERPSDVSAPAPALEEGGTQETPAPAPSAPAAGFPKHWPESVTYAQVLLNLRDLGDAPEARVHFYPNGTCDALSVTLLSELGEERRLTLEITTARERVEVVR